MQLLQILKSECNVWVQLAKMPPLHLHNDRLLFNTTYG